MRRPPCMRWRGSRPAPGGQRPACKHGHRIASPQDSHQPGSHGAGGGTPGGCADQPQQRGECRPGAAQPLTRRCYSC